MANVLIGGLTAATSAGGSDLMELETSGGLGRKITVSNLLASLVTLGAATKTGAETLTNKTLTSPALSGTPTAPTAAAGTNTTQVATTAFVATALGALSGSAVSDDFLKRLCLGRQYVLSSITRTGGLVTSASGTFADGSALTYTANRTSGLVTSEVFAHAASGKTLTLTRTRTSGLLSSYSVAIT